MDYDPNFNGIVLFGGAPYTKQTWLFTSVP